MALPGSKPVSLLLVEDDPLDALAVRRALKKARLVNPLVTARDGIEAIEILQGEVSAADSGLNLLTLPSDDSVRQINQVDDRSPYLVLLDLNMPRMNGVEFLAQMRDNDEIPNCPVLILTNRAEDAEMVRMYDDMIVGYLTKSTAGKDFLRLIEMLSEVWQVVEQPS